MPRLIDAEHLKTRATDTTGDCWDNYGQGTPDLLEYIDNEPTVDAEKHGRWDTKYLSEDEDWSGIEHTIGRCSVCGGKIDITGERIPYLYCPFCGAKMDEVKDG